MFGAWMGLRRLEMAQINIATDIEDNPEEMRLLVHGKGIKERVLPVPGELARAIRRRGGDWIFPGRFDGHTCAGLRRYPHQGGHIVPQPQPAA